MNRLAAVLNYKPQAGTEYVRHYPRTIDIPPEYAATAQMLVPENKDVDYRNYMVDQLVTLVNHVLPDLLGELDPANTYNQRYNRKKAAPTTTGLPTGLTITFLEEADADTAWLQDTVFVEVDVPGNTIKVEGKEHILGYHDNITNAIEYKPGYKFQLAGAMAGTFAFNIHACRPPYRDLNALITKLKMLDTNWLPQYKQMKDGANAELWLAVFILNYFEQVAANVSF